MLLGESILDRPRLWFNTWNGVDHFLRLCQFDTDNPLDIVFLRDLHRAAVEYLADIHEYQVPAEVEQVDEIHDLFLTASRTPGGPAQRLAWMALKVMHILHHVNGQELIYRSAISEEELFDRLSNRVFVVIDRMRAAGVEVTEFSGGKKSRSSVITKLLAKRNTLASHLFDKSRLAIIVKSRQDLVHALLYLANNLFPVNYVVPEQSQNGIVTLDDIGAALSLPATTVWQHWNNDNNHPGAYGERPTPRNEFSGTNYRCINLVVDIPIRIDDIAPGSDPAIAFARAEIQLFDEETVSANEEGDSSHASYKKRQRAWVRARLEGRAGGRPEG
jgi:uncharacterized protein (TIGR04552 family)